MSDSDINSKSSHRSRQSSRSNEILKAIEGMNKKQAEDQEKRDRQQMKFQEDQEKRDRQQMKFQEDQERRNQENKEFQQAMSNSIREIGSKVDILNEDVQELKSKSSSSSKKSDTKIPEEVGPVVELESMIESNDDLVRGIMISEIGLGLALDAIKTISSIEPAALESADVGQLDFSLDDLVELPAGVTDRRSSRSSTQSGKAILFSPTWQSKDLLDPELASHDWQLPKEPNLDS